MTADLTPAAGPTAGAPARPARDRGSLTVSMLLLLVVVLGGAALLVDGGRAMSARRHAANTAEAAARAAVSTATPVSPFDPRRAKAAALDYTSRSGIPPSDVVVVVKNNIVTVTITERRPTVFLILGGVSTLTVQATGSARVVYSP